MEIVIAWLQENLGVGLSGVCYIMAAIIFAFGMGSAVMKVVGDRNETVRDVAPQVALVALLTGVMYLAGTFAPSLLA